MDDITQEKIRRKIGKSRSNLKSAKILFAEDEYEDTISRAYYAVFHAAKAALLTKGLDPFRHGNVKSMFNLHLVKTGEIEPSYADILSAEKESRERSDYDEFFIATEEDAKDMLQEAETFVERIEKYLKDSGARLD